MRHIGTDIHQVGNALTAPALGIALEQFANLEEQHHKHRLRELRLSPRQEADGQRTDGGHRHQQVLVEGIALGNALGRLLQRVITYYYIRYEINQQQLPCRQCPMVLHPYCCHQQYCRHANLPQQAIATLLVVVFVSMMFVMMFTTTMLMMMFTMMSHSNSFFLFYYLFLGAKLQHSSCNPVAKYLRLRLIDRE